MGFLGRMHALLVLISFCFFGLPIYSATPRIPRTVASPTRGTDRPVFIENRGQFDPRVRFQVRVRNQTIWLTDAGLTFDIVRSRTASTHEKNKVPLPEVDRSIFRAVFVDCLKQREIERLPELAGTYNFFSADPKRSQSGVHGYSGVIYRGLWKGIDLKLYSKDGSNLEQEFIVHKGADLAQIRLRYERVRGIDIGSDGSLSIKTGKGTLSESAPVIYATSKGHKRSIRGQFALLGPTEYGFQTDSPVDADELLIDPTLLFSTYLGGSSTDWVTGLAVDSAGSVYVTGTTSSTDFPETKSIVGSYPSYSLSVYVTKLSPDGARLIYSTLIRGAWNGSQGQYQSSAAPNASHVVALNSAGEVYVSGFSLAAFPATPNAFQQCSGEDPFISKLSSGGDQLLYSSCFGSSEPSRFASIALNASDQVYMVGTTICGAVPVTAGAYQTTCTATSQDLYAYLAVFDAGKSGSASLVYSTYFGPPTTQGFGVAVDRAGAALLTGVTSLGLPFPVTSGALQSTCQAGECPFVSRLNPSIPGQTALVSSTLFGGDSQPIPYGIALDANENVYVAGTLPGYDATLSQFPTTFGAFQRSSGRSGAIGFLAKISAGGDRLLYSTFLGGSFNEGIYALAVNANGEAVVTGQSLSSDFPVTPDALQSTLNPGGSDAFLTLFSADGSQLSYSTYLGGPNGDDAGAAVAFGSTGDVYVAGDTLSASFPTTPGALQTAFGRGNCGYPCSDGFITRFSFGSSLQIGELSVNTGGNAGSVTTTAYGSGFQTGTAVSLQCGNESISGTTAVLAGNFMNVTFNLRGVSPGTCTFKVTDPNGSTAELANDFTVVQGGAPIIWVDSVGLPRLRAGAEQSYYLVVGNRGNVDSSLVRVWIAFPTYVFGNEFSQTPSASGQMDGYTFEAFDVTVLANSQTAVLVGLTAPDDASYAHRVFQVEAWKDTK